MFFSFLRQEVWLGHDYSLDEEGIVLLDGRRHGGIRLQNALFTLDGGVARGEEGIRRVAEPFIEDINRADLEETMGFLSGLVGMVWSETPFRFFIQQESPTEITIIVTCGDFADACFEVDGKALCTSMADWLHDDIAAEILLLA